MPARLADGLGLESDLDHGCPRSYAPSSSGAGIHVGSGTVALFEEFGSPALTFRKESQLRLLLLAHTNLSIAQAGVVSSEVDVSGCGTGKLNRLIAQL